MIIALYNLDLTRKLCHGFARFPTFVYGFHCIALMDLLELVSRLSFVFAGVDDNGSFIQETIPPIMGTSDPRINAGCLDRSLPRLRSLDLQISGGVFGPRASGFGCIEPEQLSSDHHCRCNLPL